MHKIVKSGKFFGRTIRSLLKTGLLLKKSMLTAFIKSVLILLGLSAWILAADGAIQKYIYESGNTKLITANKEMNNIMKIIKSLEESGLLIKGVSETIKKEAK